MVRFYEHEELCMKRLDQLENFQKHGWILTELKKINKYIYTYEGFFFQNCSVGKLD